MISLRKAACLLATLPLAFASPTPRSCNADYHTHPNDKDADNYLVGFNTDNYTLADHQKTIGITFDATTYYEGYYATLTGDQLSKVRSDCKVRLVEDDVIGTPIDQNELQESDDVSKRGEQKNAPWPLQYLSATQKKPTDTSYWYLDDAGKGVDVYILDSGINHLSDFNGADGKTRVVDFIKQKDDSDYTDAAPDGGHGTPVADCAAGSSHGVAKSASLINVKIGKLKNKVYAPRGRYVVKAISDIIDRHNGRKNDANDKDFKGSVINMSFSIGDKIDDVVKALDDADAAGISLVAAAGNDGRNVDEFPATHPKVIAVGAVDENYGPWYDPNKPDKGTNFGDLLALWAPGKRVPASDSAGDEKKVTGTSFSSGYVSGILAIFYGVEGKAMTPSRAKDLLLKQVDDYIDFDKFVNWQGSPNKLANTGNRKGNAQKPPVKYLDGPKVDTTTATTPSGPVPSCGGPNPFNRADAVSAINAFCGDKGYIGTVVVPLVSYGSNGVLPDGRKISLGMDNVGSDGQDKFWINTYFKESSCMGMYTFEQDDCTKNLMSIVDGCDTDTTTAKKGGMIDNVCAEWRISAKANPNDANPFQLQAEDSSRMGDWTCETMPNPANISSLNNSCMCYYSKQSTVTDQFAMPSSGNCKDVKKGTLPSSGV